jgi:uncharacterized protein
MKLAYSPSITDDIKEFLFSVDQNSEQITGKLKNKINLSEEEIRKLIYGLTLNLNSSLFPAVSKLELIHTEGCNLACAYCFEKNMIGYKKMPKSIAKAAVDLLFDYALEERNLEITHFGGEPTLNFPAIKYVTEYAEEKADQTGKKISFNTTSNGVLLTDEMVDYFVNHRIRVLLSIDGLKESHDRYRKDRFGNGTFTKVKKGFDILKEKQIWVGTKMTVMPENVPNLFDDVIGLYEMGMNQFTIGHATGIKWKEEDIKEFGIQYGKLYDWYIQMSKENLKIDEFDKIKDKTGYFGCQAGRDSISVSINGEISPCSKILALNNKNLLSKLGDVHYGLTNLSNRSEIINAPLLRKACKDQGIEEEYLGGCFVSNYDDNHDLFKPSIQEHKLSTLKRLTCLGCSSCKT